MKRLYLLALCVIMISSAVAQTTKRKKPASFNKQNTENSQFLQKQWWLGFKAGTNISKAVPGRSYSVISSVDNTSPTRVKKDYENFSKLGTQIGLEITFSYKQVSISLQPTYRHARFVYSNEFEWTDADPNHHLVLTYEQEQKVDHIEIPLLVKLEMGSGKLKPYVQLGGYSAILVNANKSVKISGVNYASGGENKFEDPAIIVGAKDLFAKNHWGLIAGAGVNYNLGNVRFNLDIMYKYGMSNITSTKNRYSNDRLSGVGDALDDLKLNNLAFSLGCLFPLRFLGTGFKSIDK